MTNLALWIFAYLLNSLWQIPLVYATAWLAARGLRSLGAEVEHRVWVAALVLESLLPAASIFPWRWAALSLWHTSQGTEGSVYVVMGSGSGAGVAPFPAMVLAVVAVVYGVFVGYLAARFLWRMARLSAMRREAAPVKLEGEPARFWTRCLKRFGIKEVSIAASADILGPVTIGIQRNVVLLPVSMIDGLPEEEVCTVIAHELAHVARQDFAKNLLYEFLSLPVLYHPLLWLTRSRIRESREIICDRAAAALTGQIEYAHSLLRLASLFVGGTTNRTPHTIGIFDTNAFERRVMSLTKKSREIGGARRVAIVAACVAFGLVTSGSIMALGMHVNAFASSSSDSGSKSGKELSIPADVMQKNLVNKAIPVYPPDAKKAKIQGTVVLEAVVGKDGSVENLRVVSGPAELQQSALDAVRQWKYKPYLLNGNPVQVKTTVNIIYNLAG
jgi:TonB family protein